MRDGLGVGGLHVCVCVCVRVPATVHICLCTHAYTWEREADQWARAPNDSALHGQDSCFMSIGAHKLHGPAFSAAAARRSSLTLHFTPLPPSFTFSPFAFDN